MIGYAFMLNGFQLERLPSFTMQNEHYFILSVIRFDTNIFNKNASIKPSARLHAATKYHPQNLLNLARKIGPEQPISVWLTRGKIKLVLQEQVYFIDGNYILNFSKNRYITLIKKAQKCTVKSLGQFKLAVMFRSIYHHPGHI